MTAGSIMPGIDGLPGQWRYRRETAGESAILREALMGLPMQSCAWYEAVASQSTTPKPLLRWMKRSRMSQLGGRAVAEGESSFLEPGPVGRVVERGGSFLEPVPAVGLVERVREDDCFRERLRLRRNSSAREVFIG